MIHALGTKDNPIIFTSKNDNITIGQTKGSNLSSVDTGLWGGIIILGEAPVQTDEQSITKQLEIDYIEANDTEYGGEKK